MAQGQEVTQETVTVNVSPATDCWRLVYSVAVSPPARTAIALFESKGVTYTANQMYCSEATGDAGKAECVAWAAANGVSIPANVLNPNQPVPPPPPLP
jgi:hypothetical protein